MPVNEIRDFIFENYYKRIGFSKEKKRKDLLLLASKSIYKEILDPRNAKEHHQSYLRKKNRKSIKKQK